MASSGKLILNSDVAAAAAIAVSKLAHGSAGTFIRSDGSTNAASKVLPGEWLTMGTWLRKTTLQSIPDATLTPVVFTDAETFDFQPAGYSGLHEGVTHPSRITCQQNGFWLAIALLSYNGATGTGTDRYAYLTKNGATIIAPNRAVTVASTPHGVLAVGMAYAAVNDYLELQAYQAQGSAVNVGDYGSGTFFGAIYLGDYQ